METFGLIHLLISFTGGLAARFWKKDYFTRGFFICLLTSIFGLLAVIISPVSAARSGDNHDQHNWPQFSWLAMLLLIIAIMIFI